jgi:putative membrane protein
MNRISFACAALLAALPSAAARAADKGPTDPQIAAIVVTANQVDIDAGYLAKERSKTKDIQDFAVRMVTDHTGVNKQASDLVQKLGVKPEPNPTSESLKKGGEENLEKLKKLSGSAFDKAYVDHEVAYHEQVLDAVDKTLIPNASNAELKALLEKSRPVFASHLEHAKQVQASLAKSGG